MKDIEFVNGKFVVSDEKRKEYLRKERYRVLSPGEARDYYPESDEEIVQRYAALEYKRRKKFVIFKKKY